MVASTPAPSAAPKVGGSRSRPRGGWTGLCWRLGLPVPPASDKSRNVEGTWETDAFSGTHFADGNRGQRGEGRVVSRSHN